MRTYRILTYTPTNDLHIWSLLETFYMPYDHTYENLVSYIYERTLKYNTYSVGQYRLCNTLSCMYEWGVNYAQGSQLRLEYMAYIDTLMSLVPHKPLQSMKTWSNLREPRQAAQCRRTLTNGDRCIEYAQKGRFYCTDHLLGP